MSPEIQLEETGMLEEPAGSGTYQLNIPFIAKEVGTFDVCMQTLDSNR